MILFTEKWSRALFWRIRNNEIGARRQYFILTASFKFHKIICVLWNFRYIINASSLWLEPSFSPVSLYPFCSSSNRPQASLVAATSGELPMASGDGESLYIRNLCALLYDALFYFVINDLVYPQIFNIFRLSVVESGRSSRVPPHVRSRQRSYEIIRPNPFPYNRLPSNVMCVQSHYLPLLPSTIHYYDLCIIILFL